MTPTNKLESEEQVVKVGTVDMDSETESSLSYFVDKRKTTTKLEVEVSVDERELFNFSSSREVSNGNS
jgi:hypothetical protein